MKENKLTELMLASLQKDPKMATFEEWSNAGDYAMEIRFFPHAFNCYQNALELQKTEEIAEKTNFSLDKVTNVLEFVPIGMKEQIEDFRLSNPLDPTKWLALANTFLKRDPNSNEAKFALAFCAYCSIRSGFEVAPINEVLISLLDNIDTKSYESKKLDLARLAELKEGDNFRVVAMGDNSTLGLQKDWNVEFRDTYHYKWSQANRDHKVLLANNGIAGAGMLDAVMYLGRDAIYYKPDLAFLHFGINDVWLGPQILPAYEIMMDFAIQILKDNDIEPVIISPHPHIPENCPVNERPTDFAAEDLNVAHFVEASKRVATKNKVAYADAFSKFPADKAELEEYFANGFNHLNAKGHDLILAAVKEVIS